MFAEARFSSPSRSARTLGSVAGDSNDDKAPPPLLSWTSRAAAATFPGSGSCYYERWPAARRMARWIGKHSNDPRCTIRAPPQLMGTSLIRKMAYHLLRNGLIEPFDRQLEIVMTAGEGHNWVDT
ncbi:hypothetical protein MRX96_019257 [Rhipicephalus microplus]